jgi:hypothetical protein
MSQKFCVHCGEKLVEVAKFCSGCGQKVESSSAAVVDSEPEGDAWVLPDTRQTNTTTSKKT